jgi:hypothetical protein
MILVAAALIGVLTVPLAGGRLAQLAGVQLRRVWTVWASIAIQLSITVGGLPVSAGIAEVLHLATYALSAWCIWSNRHLPGIWLVAAGGGLNLLAIAANGGTMPATEWAWRTSGLDVAAAGQFENSGISSGSPLWFFGDVFAVPRGWPFANVFSSGDVIIVIGLLVLVHSTCRPIDAPRVVDGRDARPAAA